MRKLFLFAALVVCIAGSWSCDDTLSDDIKLDEPEMYTDPIEPKPGCDNPKGCN